MTIHHRRGADHERRTAGVLKTKRVKRRRGEVAPDVEPVRLATGDVLSIECKAGLRRVPRAVVRAIEQAARYSPSAIPIAVFRDVGGEAIACLPLAQLARLLGLQPSHFVQLPLFGGRS